MSIKIAPSRWSNNSRYLCCLCFLWTVWITPLYAESDTKTATLPASASSQSSSKRTLTFYADDCKAPYTLEVEDGKTITLMATPQTGYTFAKWTDDNTANPRIVVVNGDATYHALFIRRPSAGEGIPTYTVTIRNGSCSEATTRQFIEGAHLTMYATSDACGTFKQWSDGNTDNPRSVIVKGDATYTAEFTKEQYTVTATADNDEYGDVTVTAE